ncbi:SpoIIE family protein phosphatase [Sulfitobacter sp. HNIBRBA3233]|uniref:PP2C family protein-serine/threonine phosphatase n=1 Tax=Sulfitobacter marinivivus TaxID=3158558 RepID=UPI0032DEF478
MPTVKTASSLRDVEKHRGAIQHVLVVDDSKLQRRILTASLSRWGFSVTEAESGEQALAVIAQHRPDLIVSDWIMPGMSGPDLCRCLRADTESPYCYFILLTSKSEKAEVAHGLDSGADDFLTKPVDSNELRARIAAGERLLGMQRDLAQNNARLSEALSELRRLHEHIDKDLQEAKRLQQSLLRERYRRFDTSALSLILRSSGHVGGDLVGFFEAGPKHLGLFAIDVSGHGISSALMTARLAGYLSSGSPDQNVALYRSEQGVFCPRPPENVVADLNRFVLNEMETEHYFTLLLGFVERRTGRFEMCQAGHPHPVIQRRNGDVEFQGQGGFPVGLVADALYEPQTLHLRSGDRLLIHSDGVTECAGPDGALLSEDGLAKIIRDLTGTAGPAFLEALIWQLARFNEGGDFRDDVSAILFEYQRPPDSA